LGRGRAGGHAFFRETAMPDFDFKAMPAHFNMKFTDNNHKSFTLSLFQNSVRDGKGSWGLIAGKIRVPKGNWQFSPEGFVWFYDAQHIDFNPAVKLSATNVVKTKDTLNTEGEAYLPPEWAVVPKAGGTDAGWLTWKRE
jgi:hypothetical protein